MILLCTASSDTYITNKIINGNLRVTDTNVGRAGTLDFFKLYDETTLNKEKGQTEISRTLIKFDLSPILSYTGSKIDINSSKFKATILLYDIVGGTPIPSNFNIVAYPLSKSFDEGVGRDTISFNDIDVANFLTASYDGNVSAWFVSGAGAGGLLGSPDIDYITSGNLGSGVVDFSNTQTFVKGTEDLSIDVTKIVSATIAGLIPDEGFRLSFSDSEENDQKTRFVKRFASRHVSNPLLRPKIKIQFDDSIKDDGADFEFDSPGTIFLQSFNGSVPQNIVSGSTFSQIVGNNCLLLQLNKGQFNFYATGSQYSSGTGTNYAEGVYSSTFAISSADNTILNVSSTQTLADAIAFSGSITFATYWKSLDNTIAYHTGSLTIKRPAFAQGNFTTRKPQLRITNSNPYYTTSDKVRFRVFGVDLVYQFDTPVKRKRKLESLIYDRVYYQVFDRFSGNIVIPYDSVNNSTLLSTDTEGMFFDFDIQALVPGRSYGFQFLIVERGQSYLSKEDDTYFDVRS